MYCNVYRPKEKAKSDQPLQFAAFYLGCLFSHSSLHFFLGVQWRAMSSGSLVHHIPEMCILHFLLWSFLHNHLGFCNVPPSHVSSSSNWAKVNETILYFSTGEIKNNSDADFVWIIVMWISYFLMNANRNQTRPTTEHNVIYRDKKTQIQLYWCFLSLKQIWRLLNSSNSQSALCQLSQWRGYAYSFGECKIQCDPM